MTDDERNAVIEECAKAARMVDRLDYEWVRNSIWDKITLLSSEQVLKLKRNAPPDCAPSAECTA